MKPQPSVTQWSCNLTHRGSHRSTECRALKLWAALIWCVWLWWMKANPVWSALASILLFICPSCSFCLWPAWCNVHVLFSCMSLVAAGSRILAQTPAGSSKALDAFPKIENNFCQLLTLAWSTNKKQCRDICRIVWGLTFFPKFQTIFANFWHLRRRPTMLGNKKQCRDIMGAMPPFLGLENKVWRTWPFPFPGELGDHETTLENEVWRTWPPLTPPPGNHET